MFFRWSVIGFILLSSMSTLASAGQKKILWIVFENEGPSSTLSQPFFKWVAENGAYFTHMQAETHPSQPNYIAMVAGSDLGVSNNNNVSLVATHLADLIEAKKLKWKLYAEDYPGQCFLGESSGKYVRKHVPFLSFKNIQTNPTRCARVVSDQVFWEDVKNNTLPDFSMFIPNLDNDGHDTGIAYADRWFSKAFGPILMNPELMKNLLVIVTFDEGGWMPFGSNSIYTALFGAGVLPGSTSAEKLNHYHLLRLVEDTFDLGTLGRGDQAASSITGVWKP